jgi:hypothetical protein
MVQRSLHVGDARGAQNEHNEYRHEIAGYAFLSVHGSTSNHHHRRQHPVHPRFAPHDKRSLGKEMPLEPESGHTGARRNE